MTFALPGWCITTDQTPHPLGVVVSESPLVYFNASYVPSALIGNKELTTSYRGDETTWDSIAEWLEDNPDAQKVSYAEGLAIIREDS